MKLSGKVVAITGAGSGIGRALAVAAARRGARVAGFDLQRGAMEETAQLVREAGSDCLVVSGDVSRTEDAEAFVASVLAEYGCVDVLINNAGIIQPFVPFTKLTRAQIDRVFSVNWTGVLNMTQAFLPRLRERSEASLVNVSSMGGFCPFPGQGIYGASKAAVKLLSESLALELRGTGVTVTTVFPGGVRTNITENAPGMSEAEKKRQRELDSGYGLTPEQAAEAILRGVEKGRERVLVGSDSAILDALTRLVPTSAGRMIAAAMKRVGVLVEEA